MSVRNWLLPFVASVLLSVITFGHVSKAQNSLGTTIENGGFSNWKEGTIADWPDAAIKGENNFEILTSPVLKGEGSYDTLSEFTRALGSTIDTNQSIMKLLATGTLASSPEEQQRLATLVEQQSERIQAIEKTLKLKPGEAIQIALLSNDVNNLRTRQNEKLESMQKDIDRFYTLFFGTLIAFIAAVAINYFTRVFKVTKK